MSSSGVVLHDVELQREQQSVQQQQPPASSSSSSFTHEKSQATQPVLGRLEADDFSATPAEAATAAAAATTTAAAAAFAPAFSAQAQGRVTTVTSPTVDTSDAPLVVRAFSCDDPEADWPEEEPGHDFEDHQADCPLEPGHAAHFSTPLSHDSGGDSATLGSSDVGIPRAKRRALVQQYVRERNAAAAEDRI